MFNQIRFSLVLSASSKLCIRRIVLLFESFWLYMAHIFIFCCFMLKIPNFWLDHFLEYFDGTFFVLFNCSVGHVNDLLFHVVSFCKLHTINTNRMSLTRNFEPIYLIFCERYEKGINGQNI
ncbi:Protein CBG27563 [Caenorhabditis briggsae]|uniref:Protein CBG27563 n=1 Tax=Caenorhabditis briggsae TaxID=6238 RepID=B6IKM6_CAEBR|nr:Protein CBG27563 [Caenorhabditis briggsae]CAS00456.1 Protein CBG27563 [Caenorhabditis briggsae]